jgi:hypothetical protein
MPKPDTALRDDRGAKTGRKTFDQMDAQEDDDTEDEKGHA